MYCALIYACMTFNSWIYLQSNLSYGVTRGTKRLWPKKTNGSSGQICVDDSYDRFYSIYFALLFYV
jgi:hypothetical protein